MRNCGWVRSFVGLMLVLGVAVPAVARAGEQSRLLDRLRDLDRNDNREGPKETETVDRTIPMPANGTLKLKNFSGDIHITASNGRNEIVLKAVRRAGREQLDHIKLDVSTSGSTVTIDANKRDEVWERTHKNNNVVETRMELQVPASADLDINAFSSDVTVEGVAGDQRIETFSGEITVRDLKGEIEARTFSADISVTIGGDSKGSVTFDTFSGQLDSTLSLSTSGWRRSKVEGNLPGGPGRRMRFHTFSGDVILKTQRQ